MHLFKHTSPFIRGIMDDTVGLMTDECEESSELQQEWVEILGLIKVGWTVY